MQHLRTLALSLITYASLCVDADAELPNGLSAAQEAIELFEQLAEGQPDQHSDDAWKAYQTLADVLQSIGDVDAVAEQRRQLGA